MTAIIKFQFKRDKLREEIIENWTEKFGRAPTEQEIRGNTETLEFLRQTTDNP